MFFFLLNPHACEAFKNTWRFNLYKKWIYDDQTFNDQNLSVMYYYRPCRRSVSQNQL